MIKNQKALGKGLNALMGDNEFFEEEKINNSEITKIDINLIKPNALQPRKNFDKEELNALKVSIERNGVLQPIILRKLKKGFYEIIAGERRYRASMDAGLKEMPAIVMDVDDAKRYEISLIENMQRTNLNPIEEAMAYSSLLDTYNITQAEVSEMVGKSRSYITNTIRVANKCDEKVRDALVDEKISSGHAKILAGVDKKQQNELLDKIINEALSVRELENLIEDRKNPPDKKKVKKTKSKYDNKFIEAEENMSDKLGTKVSVSKKTINIEYYSDDDFNRIYKLVMK